MRRAQEKPRRVLIMLAFNPFLPLGVLISGQTARKRIIERSREPLEFYSDFLDLAGFPGQAHENLTVRYLIDKYRDRKPDLIMALGPSSLRYVIKYQADLGFDGPVVFLLHVAPQARRFESSGRCVASGGDLSGPHTQGREGRRIASDPIEQIRVHHQPGSRPRPRHHCAPNALSAR